VLTADEQQEQLEAAIDVTAESLAWIEDELIRHERIAAIASMHNRLASYDETKITRYQARNA
jgi:hypothetical protein